MNPRRSDTWRQVADLGGAGVEVVIRVAVCGAAGRMGRQVCSAVLADPELELVGGVDPGAPGEDLGVLAGGDAVGATVSGSVEEFLQQGSADVIVDFTRAEAARDNVKVALSNGVHAVVGTTGLSAEDLSAFAGAAEAGGANVFVAPNFAIGAVLMMRFSEIAAEHMDRAEIIELHHEQKLDAPSGTALQTATKIGARLAGKGSGEGGGAGGVAAGTEVVPGARGGELEGVRVHSVRLPGLVAHQEVIFGGLGQALTIRHDSFDRTSFMPGVIKAIKAVGERPGLTVGLDKLLGI